MTIDPGSVFENIILHSSGVSVLIHIHFHISELFLIFSIFDTILLVNISSSCLSDSLEKSMRITAKAMNDIMAMTTNISMSVKADFFLFLSKSIKNFVNVIRIPILFIDRSILFKLNLKQNYFLSLPYIVMKKIALSLFLFVSLVSISFAQALTVTDTPVVTSPDKTSLAVDWQDVSGALGYYIYYSKTSGNTGAYDFEWVDLIEVSETVLENLDANSDYFIAVTVVDENGDESPYSPEAFATTWSESPEVVSNLPSFAILEATVLSANQIELSFNRTLDDSEEAIREFKIMEKSAQINAYVSSTSLVVGDNSKLLVSLESDLLEEKEYDLTVVSIQDVDKNTIESGIDGIMTFTVPRWSTTSYEETNTNVEKINLSEEVELNAAGANPDSATIEEPTGKAWVALSDDDLVTTAASTAAETDELPTTGPETVLLLLLAMMLGGWLFFMYSKKA